MAVVMVRAMEGVEHWSLQAIKKDPSGASRP